MSVEYLAWRRLVLPLCVAAASATACNVASGDGLFEAESLNLRNCDGDIVPWEPGFYTLDAFEEKVTIRLQTIGGGIERIDGIFIQVDRRFVQDDASALPLGDPRLRSNLRARGDIDEDLRSRIPASGRSEGEPEGGYARAVIAFYDSCPVTTDVPELIGTIRFSTFEPRTGGAINAVIDAPVAVDTRTGDVIGQNISGRFKFQVQKGRPYTNFTGPGNQPQ